MKFLARLVFAFALLMPVMVQAQDRVTLGWGRLFTNDALGDQSDRWRTGSYAVSKVTGPRWSGELPTRPGEILEFRFTVDTIAPASLIAPSADDRRYAGAISLGLGSHFDLGGYDTSVSAGLTMIGPSTGVGLFQSRIHEILNMDVPTTVLDDQIPDQILPQATFELAKGFDLTEAVRFRPFAMAQTGPENLVRVGADVVVGRLGRKDLMLRDANTGHLFRGIVGDSAPQFSLVLGADQAHVFNSVYLPADGPAVLLPDRSRIRAGYLWQGADAFVFSGLTYLSPEFAGQTEGQIVGSLTVSFGF